MREVSSAVSVVCFVILTCITVFAGLDLHAMRRAQVDELREFVKFREGYMSRYDSFLWRLQDLTEGMGSTNKILADALVRMRAQVKEQVDHSAKTQAATVTIAREATKQAAATSELVQQVADVAPPKPPTVNVQPASPAPTPVVVQTPPAAIARPTAPQPAPPRRRRRWYHFWLW